MGKERKSILGRRHCVQGHRPTSPCGGRMMGHSGWLSSGDCGQGGVWWQMNLELI